MKLNAKKELIPVVYGESSVKILSAGFGPNSSGFDQHWHDRIELHLVKSGELNLSCNGEQVAVKPGELSIISPTFSHGGEPSTEGVEYYVIMFDIKDLYNSTLSSQQYLEPIINGDVCFKYKTDIPQIIDLANDIIEMNINSSEHHPLETVGSLYRLLGLLCRYCIDGSRSKQYTNDKFDSVINYINSNFARDISVDSVSRKFNYEKSYFCRKFKSTTGMNATKYIRIQRLEHARNLLEKTDKSIIDIAISCGFKDSPYFINCFKAMYGITPIKYRASHKS